MIGQESAVSQMRQVQLEFNQGNFCNVLITGPLGSGKVSFIIQIIFRELSSAREFNAETPVYRLKVDLGNLEITDLSQFLNH